MELEKINNQAVKMSYEHLQEKPIEHYINQFINNKIINKDKDPEVEEIIKIYWNLQDPNSYFNYFINPIQQSLTALFKENPNIIEKLYKCRSKFNEQTKRYTESVQAIVTFGRYNMFTTEFDNDADNPAVSDGKTGWNEKGGYVNKQFCLLFANKHSSFMESIVSPDDKRYATGLNKAFSELKKSSYLKLSSISSMFAPTMGTLESSAYVDGNDQYAHTSYKEKMERKNKNSQTYDICFGNMFNRTNDRINKFYDSKYMNQDEIERQNIDVSDIYSGLISKYGIIETHSLDKEKYREELDKYLKNAEFREDNPQLFTYTWNRFNSRYELLLNAFVDRAIMSIHQSMVDYLISIYENSFTIPQLMRYYCPGTMIKIDTPYGVPQCAMVLYTKYGSSRISRGNGLTVYIFNPNIVKTENILIHDYEGSNSTLTNNRFDFRDNTQKQNSIIPATEREYTINTIASPNRGDTIFKYFQPTHSVSLMTDDDVRNQFEYNKLRLSMMSKPVVKDLDGIYFTNTFLGSDATKNVPVESKGRVIVDCSVTKSIYSDYNPEELDLSKTFNDVITECTLESYKNNVVYPGLPFTKGGSTNKETFIVTSKDMYDDIRYLLSLPVTIPIFSLTNKMWALAKVNELAEPIYKDAAFNDLVLKDDIKKFILDISKYQNKNNFKDIIKGKESGSIFLLCGSPGCGKTLTAEAIAENLHRPLYKITAGELGTNNKDIDYNLDRILTQVVRWNAILLIDEADVYIEKRTDNNITRNAIVSIFLRQLEYYKGVLFLTTNRSDNIDPAFLSRVTQVFDYPELTDDERLIIWKNLMNYQDVKLDDQQASTLSKYKLNGRQIKNAIRAAIARALASKTKLTYALIIETLEIMTTINIQK